MQSWKRNNYVASITKKNLMKFIKPKLTIFGYTSIFFVSYAKLNLLMVQKAMLYVNPILKKTYTKTIFFYCIIIHFNSLKKANYFVKLHVKLKGKSMIWPFMAFNDLKGNRSWPLSSWMFYFSNDCVKIKIQYSL